MTDTINNTTTEPTGWTDDTKTQNSTATTTEIKPWQPGDDIALYDPQITELLTKVHTAQTQLITRRTALQHDIHTYKLECSAVKCQTSEFVKKMEKSFLEIEKLG